MKKDVIRAIVNVTAIISFTALAVVFDMWGIALIGLVPVVYKTE